jgi:acyl carrier protein
MQASSQVAALFSDVLGIPVESITDETSPENTPQWDSLQSMNLVMAMESAFGVRLSTKEIVSMKTVGIARNVLRARGIENA